MKPLVTFSDPEAAVIDYLKAVLAGRNESYKPGTVNTSFPSVALAGTHVQVELDGVPGGDYPLTERATVRVTCYAKPGRPSDAKSLASLVQGLLYTHPGDARIFGIVPLTGRLRTVDPSTKNELVSMTFRVSMRPAAA